jgi:exopolyphosphatase/guanosine-5'-triphosphate,3'-diphosphate pyrophosphatase
MLSQLACIPLSERVEVPGLHADRAPTIVAGVVILVETMRAFDLDRITVSEHDILYGAALAAASSGR